eukprot:scaffold265_cov118-Isochrysis_galbana.AAC.4
MSGGPSWSNSPVRRGRGECERWSALHRSVGLQPLFLEMSHGPSWSNSPVRLGSVKGGKALDFCAYIDREKMLVYDHQIVL